MTKAKKAPPVRVRCTYVELAVGGGHSGGNFDNFIHKEFSGTILYCTILDIN